MGRRALRKIDPQLDLSAHFLTLEKLPRPGCAQRLFTEEAPLEIEVGSGKGLFLQNAAQENPQHNFLGLEVSHKYARFTAARLAKRQLSNALAVHGDGLQFLREFVPDNSVRAIHVYFPDPWWKKRHHRRRVLNEAFLADVVRTLEPQGRLHFWTDVPAYYQNTLELIANTTHLLQGPLPVAQQPATHDLDYRTHFERRTRLQGAPVFRAEFEKTVGSGK